MITSVFRALVNRVPATCSSNSRGPRARRANHSCARQRSQLRVESLESRRVLSTNALVAAHLDKISTQEDGAEVRAELIDAIWLQEGELPTRAPSNVTTNLPSSVPGLPNLRRMDRLFVRMDSGFGAQVDHFIPAQRQNRLMLVHQGHANGGGHGIDLAIRRFVAEGFDVLAFDMPGFSGTTAPSWFRNHDSFASFESPQRNPVKYFVEPIAVALEHVDADSFVDVGMTGVSGGGWTTTLYAAIDPRIQYSFPVAGSLPRFLRVENDRGDWEQHDAGGIYDAVANYLQLYTLGSMDDGRVQVQILNHGDPCCFDGASGRHRAYDRALADHVSNLGDGRFRVVVDPNQAHSISTFALNEMLQVMSGVQVEDDGGVAFSRSGTWKQWSKGGHQGDVVFAAAGNGERQASWRFDVHPGTYSVAATWLAHPNRATDAPFVVYDGANVVHSLDVNQQLWPNGRSVGGSSWQEIGTVETTTGNLRVALSNDANGYVIADAIRITQIRKAEPESQPELDLQPISHTVSTPPPEESEPAQLDHSLFPRVGDTQTNWHFDVLPGSHAVYATWTVEMSRSTGAQYGILDGATRIASKVVNQQLAPSDRLFDGQVWHLLDTIEASGSRITVTLQNTNGRGDAVRVVALDERGQSTTKNELPPLAEDEDDQSHRDSQRDDAQGDQRLV